MFDDDEMLEMKWRDAIKAVGLHTAIEIRCPNLPIWLSVISILMSVGAILLKRLGL